MRRRVERFRQEYREMPDPVMGVAEGDEITDFEAQTFDTYEYEGVVGESRRILGRIMDAIDERERDGGRPVETVVLGRSEYVAVDAWIRWDSGGEASLKTHLADYNIVTVPGRMIHIPQANQRAIVSHLNDDD